MAIVWHTFRDKMEPNPGPPTVNGQTPIEGGVLVRHDDSADTVRYCFYILVRGALGAAGQYIEDWRVMNAAKNQSLAAPNRITVTVPANNTDLILIPPVGAGTGSEQDISLGNVADPSDAQLVAAVSAFSASIAARFSASGDRATAVAAITGYNLQAQF